MNGETALKFARSRHSSSDFARGERQIELLLAIQEKLVSLKTLENIPLFFKSISKSIKTDLTLETVADFSPILSQLSNFKIVKIGLSTTNVLTGGTSKSGASILVPKSGSHAWQDTHSFIQGELKK